MKKILFAIALVALCAGCDTVERNQWLQYVKEGDAGGFYVVERIPVPLNLVLTNTFYEITHTNATFTFVFGIEKENGEK